VSESSLVTAALGGGGLIATFSFLWGNSIVQSVGVALVVISTILLGMDLLGISRYHEELEKLTSGGLWIHELETLTDNDLDGDEEVGR
jgi:hypothetical protein